MKFSKFGFLVIVWSFVCHAYASQEPRMTCDLFDVKSLPVKELVRFDAKFQKSTSHFKSDGSKEKIWLAEIDQMTAMGHIIGQAFLPQVEMAEPYMEFVYIKDTDNISAEVRYMEEQQNPTRGMRVFLNTPRNRLRLSCFIEL